MDKDDTNVFAGPKKKTIVKTTTAINNIVFFVSDIISRGFLLGAYETLLKKYLERNE